MPLAQLRTAERRTQQHQGQRTGCFRVRFTPEQHLLRQKTGQRHIDVAQHPLCLPLVQQGQHPGRCPGQHLPGMPSRIRPIDHRHIVGHVPDGMRQPPGSGIRPRIRHGTGDHVPNGACGPVRIGFIPDAGCLIPGQALHACSLIIQPGKQVSRQPVRLRPPGASCRPARHAATSRFLPAKAASSVSITSREGRAAKTPPEGADIPRRNR